MELIDFINEGYFILVAVLYVVGEMVKKTDIIKDKYIPIFLTVCGIAGALAIGEEYTNSIFQGILCSGIAVLGNQTIKQLGKKE